MKRKLAAILCVAALVLCMAGCSEKEETTTLTGMVVSVEGTVVNIMDMSNSSFQGNWSGSRPSGSEGSERPSASEGSQRPEGGFTLPEGVTMPEGMTRPEGGFSGMEGFDPNNFNGQLPKGMTLPEGMTIPEGGFDPNNFDGQLPEGRTKPEGGNRPSGSGDSSQMETTAVDLANAHISIQDGDIKAAGSISDIKVGSMLTITLNGKGVATEVLVTSSGFGGGNFGGNFGGRGQGGKDKGNTTEENGAQTA